VFNVGSGIFSLMMGNRHKIEVNQIEICVGTFQKGMAYGKTL
jgi:hypothetical protein